jgi:acyl dehydratase
MLGQCYTTPRRTITETDIVNFACLTGDFHPLHMDQLYAETTAYKTRIAHGPLTFALAVGLIAQAGLFANSFVLFLGANDLRFPLPVRAGDTLVVEARVTEWRASSKPDKGVLKMHYAVKNQNAEETMSVDMSFLVPRRPS